MSDTLILNANYQPLSWLPLSVIPWQQSVKLHFMDRIKILEYYDDWEIHSPSVTMFVPALAIPKDYHSFSKGIRFSRQNLGESVQGGQKLQHVCVASATLDFNP